MRTAVNRDAILPAARKIAIIRLKFSIRGIPFEGIQ
jgi:hypothetical protein